jgi:tripartite-type tricarboxylate transporter receptor subunit TctC
VLALPAVQTRLRGLGAEPSPSSGEEMKAMVETQISVWNDVIKAVGIKKR